MTAGSELDPERLIVLARAGSGAALGELLAAYRNYLTLLARVQIDRRLQRKLDASDVVQEVYLAAHQHFVRLRGRTEGELVAWLRQILATGRLEALDQGFAELDGGALEGVLRVDAVAAWAALGHARLR
jgi:RNA polymerase sigma-70 factor (ECF subfamily)